MHRFSANLTVVVLSAAALTSCTTAPTPSPTTPVMSPTPAPLGAVAASWAHVHGLGVDPADGALYIATHEGLYRSTAEGVEGPVAGRRQDTMGFTVAGSSTFLGSGHPDLEADPDLPSPLGMVVSRDSGTTWDPVSLGGQVDFHALRASASTVYGWDATSGQLLVSSDLGDSWTARDPIALRDLAIDPSDADTVLATTAEGLQRSSDGGRTWSAVPAAPLLLVVAWSVTGALYGVDTDGIVQHSPDAGATWTAGGDVGGVPEALAVSPPAAGFTQPVLHVAVAREGEGSSVERSTDGGQTFRDVTT